MAEDLLVEGELVETMPIPGTESFLTPFVIKH